MEAVNRLETVVQTSTTDKATATGYFQVRIRSIRLVKCIITSIGVTAIRYASKPSETQ